MGCKPRRRVVVLSGTSGAGKGTVLGLALERDPELAVSVSHTTRAPRPSEQPGRSYHFVSDEEFDRMIAGGEFVEWAEVHSNRYGTSMAELERLLDQGRDVVLEIDCQGGLQVRDRMPAVLVFLAPPGPEEMLRRIEGRGEDSEAAVKVRLANAAGEFEQARARFDYLIVNDELGTAVEDFLCVVRAERLRVRGNEEYVRELGDRFARYGDRTG